MSILIVEDNPISSKMLELNLQKKGYFTHVVSSGKEALEYLSDNFGVQLVIADILMPEMDGLELLRELKNSDDLKDIPVIMCSSKKDAGTVKKAAELGCRHYLVKPVNTRDFLEKVGRLIKEDEPILRSKTKVRVKLSLDPDVYKELDAAFSILVFDKIELLENQEIKGFPENINASLLELNEGATLLGADRLKLSLDRLAAQDTSKSNKPFKNLYSIILNELKLVREQLQSKPLIKIRYETPESTHVSLFIERYQGPMVCTLVDENKPEGQHEYLWDGTNNAGDLLKPGLYIIHLNAGSNIQQKVIRLEKKRFVVDIDA